MIPACHPSEDVNGLTVIHREAGPNDAPTIVLPHDVPSSSRMLPNPAPADRHHVIAQRGVREHLPHVREDGAPIRWWPASDAVSGGRIVRRAPGGRLAAAALDRRVHARRQAGTPSSTTVTQERDGTLSESPRDDAAPSGPISELDASVFATTRPRLFAIACRFLGDVGEAEDVVQEAWLRWARADRSVVVNPAAFLAMTTSRLAINVAQSARRRRETPAGPWLPETVDSGVSLETAAELHEAVDEAVRLLLEKLTPAERAAYLLRKAFDYPYRRISEVLHLGVDHTRQLVRRAHERIATERRQPVDTTAHQRLVQTFLAAARTGALAELEELLAADIPMRRSA